VLTTIRLSEIEEVPVRVDRTLELVGLVAGDGGRLIPGSVRLRGEVQRTQAGVELRADWAATIREQCCRCLEPFETVQGEAFFLVLTPEAVEFGPSEQEMRDEDAFLYYVADDLADLAEVVAEQILLAQPLKPICREDCAGLCPTCGVNRNRIECGCRRDEVDPRLAPLLEMKDRFGED